MRGGPVRIAAADARRLAVAGQRLCGTRPRATRAGLLGLIRDIGYLQLDPTNVVARNPYLVLWSRVGGYDPALLDSLLTRTDLFETPSLLLPAADLPLHAATLRAYRRATEPGGTEAPYGEGDNAGGGTWARYARGWLTQNRHVRREVLARLRREGPLPLTAFSDRAVSTWTGGAGWGNERNIGMLLAILHRRGEIVVAARRRGHKVYAVADGWPGVRPLSSSTLAREATRRALGILQVATLKQLKRQYSFGRHVTPDALASLERAGEVVRVEIEGESGVVPGAWYAPAGVEERARSVRRDWTGRTTPLSPFDNLVIDRDRLLALFGYFYRIEIYTPVAKRRLGYWAMPVLHGDRIVGSVDPRLDRERGVLVVNKVVLEKGAARDARRAIRGAVNELAEWTGARAVSWPSRVSSAS